MGNLTKKLIKTNDSKESNSNPKSDTNESAISPCKIYHSPSQTRSGINVRALFSLISDNNLDLSFNKGDILVAFSDLSDQWVYARHETTKETGFVPGNYIVIEDGSPKSHDSWFDIGRTECEKKLVHLGYQSGTYVIRPCADAQNYALSIRNYNTTKNVYEVRHYKIRASDDGEYFISQKYKFTDIQSLLDYYSKTSSGLCCRLEAPFPREHRPPVHFREIEVDRDCIMLKRKLGSGSFGDVWLAILNNTVQVAVKMLKQDSLEQRNMFLNEAKSMHQLYHPRIVEILGVCSEPQDCPVYIITELMIRGSLLMVLNCDAGKSLAFRDLIFIMNQIADGMSYLESKNFIHRDLRAANILVADDFSVKVADFGLSMCTEHIYEAVVGSKFPIKWTAPEAGINRTFSIKSDVWSFGVVMYEIITYGGPLYVGIPTQTILHRLQNGYRLPNPKGEKIKCPVQLYNIMLSCWDSIPENRPKFHDLKDIFDDFPNTTESNSS